jgi:hypothetical protein
MLRGGGGRSWRLLRARLGCGWGVSVVAHAEGGRDKDLNVFHWGILHKALQAAHVVLAQEVAADVHQHGDAHVLQKIQAYNNK